MKRVKEEIQENPHIYKCKYCLYETLHEQRLEIHLKTHCDGSVIDDASEIYNPVAPIKHEEIMLEDDKESIEIIQGLNSHSQEVFDTLIKIEAEALEPKIKQKCGLSEKILTCKLCNFRTLQRERYKEHVKTHCGSRAFKCDECDYITTSSEILHRHKLSHTHKCFYCNYKASSKHYLDLHLEIHDGSVTQVFKRGCCSYNNINSTAVASHQNQHSDNNIQDINNEVSPQQYEENFNKKIDMPFKCEECSYKTLRQDYLDRHINFHHKEKLLKCEECGQKFALHRSLLLHLKSHVKQEN